MPILIFVLSAAFILWVLAGYPLFLGLLTRFFEKPFLREYSPRAVSVILPVYNGERWVRAKLESILGLDYPRDLVQIIVVSDGSTDRTDDLVREFAGQRVELVRVPQGGKALALNAGMARAHGEILFFTDVRQALEKDSLRRLVECFADPSIGVVSGELVIRKGGSTEEADIGLYWRYEKWIRKHQSRLCSVPGATGSIYAMRRSLARPLPAATLNDDMHLPLFALFAGCRVVFEGQAKAYDYPTALGSEFRRKVRTLAGVYQVIAAFPGLLSPLSPIWIHFISHKAGRLLLPHAMIAIAASSFYLPGPWAWMTLVGQAAFYALAALDPWMAALGPLKRLSSLARVFVTMMIAAFLAQSYFFRDAKTMWKTTEVKPAA